MEDGLDALLRDRALTMVNERSAVDVLPYADGNVGGLLLAGADAPVRCREIRNAFPRTVVAMDYGSHTHAVANADEPFGLMTRNGWRPLDLRELNEVLDGQLANGASFAVTPTAFVPAAETAADRTLHAVIAQANHLRRDDTVVVLPCSYAWLRNLPLRHLAERIRTCRHPVALIMQAGADPLERTGVPDGLRQLCRSCPRLLLWRTDLAAIDAVVHGALGSAIGATAGLRHGIHPQRNGGGSGGKPYPVVLVRELLRYVRVETLQDWFAHTDPWTCDCAVCQGTALTRFTDRPQDVLSAMRHNVCTAQALAAELQDTLPGHERLAWWRQQLDDAAEHHRRLAAQTDMEARFPRVLQSWRRTSPLPLPLPEEPGKRGRSGPS